MNVERVAQGLGQILKVTFSHGSGGVLVPPEPIDPTDILVEAASPEERSAASEDGTELLTMLAPNALVTWSWIVDSIAGSGDAWLEGFEYDGRRFLFANDNSFGELRFIAAIAPANCAPCHSRFIEEFIASNGELFGVSHTSIPFPEISNCLPDLFSRVAFRSGYERLLESLPEMREEFRNEVLNPFVMPHAAEWPPEPPPKIPKGEKRRMTNEEVFERYMNLFYAEFGPAEAGPSERSG